MDHSIMYIDFFSPNSGKIFVYSKIENALKKNLFPKPNPHGRFFKKGLLNELKTIFKRGKLLHI